VAPVHTSARSGQKNSWLEEVNPPTESHKIGTAALLPMGQGTPMFYDQAILIQWLKEWDGRPARLFCFIRYGQDARATLCCCPGF
jgi:hypothetical protein